MRGLLSLAMFVSAAAVTCPEHHRVYGSYSNIGATEVECPAGQFCMRIMTIQPSCNRSSGDGGIGCIGAIEQKCSPQIYPFFAGGEMEASVGTCCREAYSSMTADDRVILFDTNPGVIEGHERNAYMAQYDDENNDYTECPCMCKYNANRQPATISSRRRQWWGPVGANGGRSEDPDAAAAAVLAQANCPFAADHEPPAPTPAPTPSPPPIVVSATFTFALADAAVTAVMENEEVHNAFLEAFKKDIGDKLGLGGSASLRRINVTHMRRGSLLVDFTVTSEPDMSKQITQEKFTERMTGEIELEELSSDDTLIGDGVVFPASVPASSVSGVASTQPSQGAGGDTEEGAGGDTTVSSQQNGEESHASSSATSVLAVVASASFLAWLS